MPNLIYFGNFAEIEVSGPDNHSVLEGVRRSGRLELQYINATVTDPENDGIIHDNEYNNTSWDNKNPAQDELTYTLQTREGPVTRTDETDASMSYNAVITPEEGDPFEQRVIVIQMQNGDVFITDLANGPQLDGMSIQAIELKTYQNSYRGWQTSQSIENASIVCFARGTMIATQDGARAVEALRIGDPVLTIDNGLRPIRWIGSHRLSSADLNAASNLRPIRIKAGALGKNTPSTDLVVSPQHRILVRSKIAQRMFGTMEVLAAAKQLCQLDGIDIAEDISEIEYFHFLFDQHEVVYSNGAETESLYSGAQALKSVGAAARDEIFTLFPQLKASGTVPLAARELLEGRMARKLAARHLHHSRPLVL